MAEHVSANELLLDRHIVDNESRAAGRVDDLELSDPVDGRPRVTALLCGPVALGPRIGGRLGRWWRGAGGRLGGGDRPVRIPIEQVDTIDKITVRLSVPRAEVGTSRLAAWVIEHLVSRIPGGRR